MPNNPHHAGFTIRDLLAVTAVVGVLSALAALKIESARARARRDECSSKLKCIGFALLNYNDALKEFPSLTSQGCPAGSANVWATVPGQTYAPNRPRDNGYQQAPARAAGYSWIVQILPYFDTNEPYQSIERTSEKKTYEAFSATGKGGKPFTVAGDKAGHHFSTIRLEEVICPGFEGSWISTASSGTAKPAVALPTYEQLYTPASGKLPSRRVEASGVAITNYVALSATHLACMATDPAQMNESNASSVEEPNGTIVPGRGIRMKQVSDGTSRTLMVCESKEPAVSSWYDGTVAWCVGINPNGPQPLRSLDPDDGSLGFWDANGGSTALNVGPAPGKTAPLYAPHGTTVAQTQPVSWGPSSYHSGGVVLHFAVDGSVHVITPDIDPTLYLRLITRAGGEPQVQLPDVGN